MNAVPAPAIRQASGLYWLCQIGGWGFYAIANILAGVGLEHAPLLPAILQLTLLGTLGVAMTHALRAYLRMHHWSRMDLRARVPRVVGASMLLSTIASLVSWSFGLAEWQNTHSPIEGITLGPSVGLLIHWFNWMSLLLVWCTIYFSVQSARERRSAELRESQTARALQASELRSLKSQLNPHFLFNALNTVRALISIDAPRAQLAITQLARTLRYTLNASQGEFVTFEQEMGIVDDYLALESLRLGERLTVQSNINSAALAVRIPVMLLQTLVENAIKHGIAELQGGGVLKILATLDGGALTLVVENPRPESSLPAGEGIGLRNARERLRLLYGPAASFHLDMSQPRAATARLSLPVKHENSHR